jgi:soluble lytic murein transglycosylase-like protein
MKNLLLTIIVSLASTFVMAYSIVSRQISKNIIELEPERPLALTISPIKVKIKIPSINQNELFLTSIGRRESSNRYDIVNKWGYMGKYQFGRKTLNTLGYKNISNKQFLTNPKLQEEAMLKLLRHNKHILRREIKKYCGTQKYGVYITESGLLAAAHLAGPGNVKKWLKRGKRFRDGLGTDLVEYLLLFGNYKINI